ncbi:MAG: hypothetical protein ACYCV7_06580 [Acidimicrobiales bacterium]
MRWLALPKTIGLAGILAGSALVAGGGGLGVAALASAQPAGALSAQLPAVGVREQNVNSAGRIRVALPKGGVGVNGNVNVSNFPKTQAVKVTNFPPSGAAGTGVPHMATQGPWFTLNPGQTSTLVNVTGSGTFIGLTAAVDSTAGPDCWVHATIDGNTVFTGNCSWGVYNSGIYGGTSVYGSREVHFTPPTPMKYSKSLVVTITSVATTSPNQYWASAWYTTNG